MYERKMYKVIQTEKGRSVVATKNYDKGTIIIKEIPAVVCEDLYDAIYRIYTPHDTEGDEDQPDVPDIDDIRYKYENMMPHKIDKFVITSEQIEKEIEKLPTYMKEFFYNMDQQRLRLLCAKFYRNAFTYDTKYGGPSAILFKGSLLNHSCDPNIDFHIDRSGFFVFTTNRPVFAGEELCDKYLDTTLSYKKRQDILLTQYGFECKCTKCT
jgi:hypothetical protein